MNIDKMPAGRDMDVLVAGRVFDYSLTGDGYIKLFDAETKNPSVWVRQIPHYSTDIAAAWQVAMKFTGFSIGHRNGTFEGYVDGSPESLVYAETAPLAICRAALKAVMGRDKD